MKSNIKSKKGFTIIELLVVIVVIGILAAISIVSYSGVKAKADLVANKQIASDVLNAANVVLTDTGAYPLTNAAKATVVGYLNASYVKIPATTDVSNVTTTGNGKVSYRLNTAKTGICVGYWDPTASAPAPAYLFGGTATDDDGTTCS